MDSLFFLLLNISSFHRLLIRSKFAFNLHFTKVQLRLALYSIQRSYSSRFYCTHKYADTQSDERQNKAYRTLHTDSRIKDECAHAIVIDIFTKINMGQGESMAGRGSSLRAHGFRHVIGFSTFLPRLMVIWSKYNFCWKIWINFIFLFGYFDPITHKKALCLHLPWKLFLFFFQPITHKLIEPYDSPNTPLQTILHTIFFLDFVMQFVALPNDRQPLA
jgi:hypothetical protein